MPKHKALKNTSFCHNQLTNVEENYPKYLCEIKNIANDKLKSLGLSVIILIFVPLFSYVINRELRSPEELLQLNGIQ